MESPENIAGGYSQSGGWGGSGSDPNNNDRGGDTRTVDELRAAQEINLLNTNAYLNDINLSNPRGIDQVMNLFTSQYGPSSRRAFNTAYDRTLENPGGIRTLGYNTAKTLNRLAPEIFSGQVKNNVPQLTGTVFGKKNKAGETLISSGGKSMGISAEDYYSGLSGSDIPVVDAETLLVGRPDLETYQDKYGYATPQERELQRAYDQYMNPYNDPNLTGYNRDVTNIGAGEVRPGLQSGIFSDMSGTPTQLGPVATYDRNYSGTDNLAMTGFGTMGTLARALTNKVTGIEGQPLPAAALAPTPEMIAQGQTSGGMARSFSQIPGQIRQGIESLIAPNVPAPNPVQTAPLDLGGFEQRFGSTNPLSGETSGSPVPRSSISRNPTQQNITEEFVRDPAILDALMSGANLPAQIPISAGEQLAGGLFDSLFRDPNISPEAREILEEKGMTIDDLFAPKTSTPEPEKPNIMDLIQGVTQTSALNGPTTLIT